MVIPKGSYVISNIWYVHIFIPYIWITIIRAMTKDKRVYGENVEEFDPERFIEGAEDSDIMFGFGRRYVLYLFSL